MKFLISILLLGIFIFSINCEMRKFPKELLFGTASSAYQVEGAWNDSDKGENIWDHMTHHRKELILGESNGDNAVKSFDFYMRDVQILKELGVDFYRFSISWSRLLPQGFSNKISKNGLDYYNNLINALLDNGITPIVTIFHWDLPQCFQDIGGWANPTMAEYFKEYARVCFDSFGDRVKTWITINEPKQICLNGYAELFFAPALDYKGIAEYLCGHTVLKAHGMAYRLYDEKYRSVQKGRIGIDLDSVHNEPANEDEASYLAAKIKTEFELGWFANPIFSANGDYPDIMKKMIAEKSKSQGYPKSRLPEFTKDEIEMLKGSSDFFGTNHYSSSFSTLGKGSEDEPSWLNDTGVDYWVDESWPSSASLWLKVTPWGFRKILAYIKNTYNNPEMMVFENGFSTSDGSLNDTDRVDYYHGYINALLDAIEIDRVNVTAYTAWCLADNFEWQAGYSQRFGLYSTNFTDPKRTLTAKDSAKYYSNIIRTRQIEGIN